MRPERFDRAPVEFKPLLEHALALVPGKVREAISPRFLCGADPGFVGLHHDTLADYRDHYGAFWSGHDYDELAHACYLRTCGRQTVVIPKLGFYDDDVDTVLHEVGHLYDEATGFRFDAPETLDYSALNRQERFACAFSMVVRPIDGLWRLWAETAEWVRPFRTLVGAA